MHLQSLTKRVAILGIATTLAAALAACGGSSTSSSSTEASAASAASSSSVAGPKVVASTSWVGAVAKMAGATNITVIAPSNIQHPPDYDPKASDLAALSEADYVLMAGFEGFAQRMKDAAGSTAKMLMVAPDYDPAKLKVEVDKLATEWGTTEVADANMATYTTQYNDAAAALQKTTSGKPEVVVAHAFVANWAGFAGYTPAGIFGPDPLTPAKVAELVKLKPTLVFENSHMPGGTEIATPANAVLVSLINFPGDDLELMPVVNKNAETITAAVGG